MSFNVLEISGKANWIIYTSYSLNFSHVASHFLDKNVELNRVPPKHQVQSNLSQHADPAQSVNSYEHSFRPRFHPDYENPQEIFQNTEEHSKRRDSLLDLLENTLAQANKQVEKHYEVNQTGSVEVYESIHK